MSRGSYYFDPEACAFVKVERDASYYAKRATLVLGVALALAVGVLWLMDAYWVDTPEELALKSENEVLHDKLSQVSKQMNVLTGELDELAQRDQTLYRTLLQAEPISEDVRQVGVGGSDPYAAYNRFDEGTATLLRETSSTLDQLERQVRLQQTSYKELSEYADDREVYLEQLPALVPAQGPLVSSYGKRYHPILKVMKMHGGVDILVRTGTPVVAPADGIVRRAGHSPSYGYYVDLRHPGSGYMTRFAHLSEFADGIRRGRRVARGDTIAFSGNTGRSTGPHLHYEVRDLQSKRTLNPMYFFAPDMKPDRYRELLAQMDAMDMTMD